MNLSNLKPAEGSTRNNKRLGRGEGSGGGGTATRGHKGAKSRSGYSRKSGFEGGQMPLQRRVPKFGFKNINRVEYKGINLDVLQSLFEAAIFPPSVRSMNLAFESSRCKKAHLSFVLHEGHPCPPSLPSPPYRSRSSLPILGKPTWLLSLCHLRYPLPH